MRNLLFVLFSMASASLLAQGLEAEKDSVNIRSAGYDLNFQPYDYTDLKQFQTYRLDFGSIPQAHSGNLGLPIHLYDSIPFNLGITSLLGAYQPYLVTRDNMRFYQTDRPFSSLDYVNGVEKEQYFKAYHTQNFGEAMNLAFEYDRMSSEGFFAQQLTNHTRFHTNFQAKTRNERYKAQVYFIINTLESQENGGVFVSEENQEDNTVLLDIGLNGAQNRSRSQELGGRQSYELIQAKDSGAWAFSLALGHEMQWNKAFRNYKDLQEGNDGFYQEAFIDTIASNDTTFASELINKVFLDVFEGKFSVATWSKSNRFFQNYIVQEEINSQYVGVSFSDSIVGLALNAEAEQGLSGYYQEELMFRARLGIPLAENYGLNLAINHEKRRANPLMERVRTNRHYYTRNLQLMQQSFVLGQLRLKKEKLDLQLKIENTQNLLYFGSDRQLRNAENDVQRISAKARKEWKFGRHWNLVNELNFQEISEDTLLPLPSFFAFNSFFYEGLFFNKALLLQLGADFYYIGEYVGYTYDPSQAAMHLRSDQNRKLGSIPQIDFFINMRIANSARIFFKMENVFQTPYDINSERVQGYPNPGRALKFGLSWRMIN